MPIIDVDIVLAEKTWPNQSKKLVEQAIQMAATHTKIAPSQNQQAELCVLLTNDDQQRQLNQTWREINKTTNVLSFPQIEPFSKPVGMLGDMSLAYETVLGEAAEQAKSLDDHLTHLVVHGFLHILGYDHLTNDDAEIMEQLEIDILGRLGLENPYSDMDVE